MCSLALSAVADVSSVEQLACEGMCQLSLERSGILCTLCNY